MHFKIMKVQVNKSTVVKPASATPCTILRTTLLDARMPLSYHTQVMYVFRFNGDPNFFDPTLLKEALSRALVPFYPVAGRLQRDDTGIGFKINCNGEGIPFIEAECDAVIDELLDLDPRDTTSLFPTVDYSGGISSYPLVLLQLTRFKCGGVCLGYAGEHHLADGISSVHFSCSWSEITRGVPITIAPFLERTILEPRHPPRPKFEHIEYQKPPTMNTPCPHKNQPLIFKKLKLSRKQINALKEKCPGSTTYEVVAGHAWRCLCKVRMLPGDQQTKMYIPVDGRSRLRPTLPAGYYGNVVFVASPITSVGEIISNPLEDLVRKIHKEIARMDDEYLRSSLDYLAMLPDPSSTARGTDSMNCPNIYFNGWFKLPFYEVDFGWGRPIYAGPGSLPPEGKIFLIVNPAEEGSLFYTIALPEEQMALFEKLLYEDINETIL